MHEAFKDVDLNERAKENTRFVAEAFDNFLKEIERYVPPGRERSLVVTKLEEACYFAKKGLALRPESRR